MKEEMEEQELQTLTWQHATKQSNLVISFMQNSTGFLDILVSDGKSILKIPNICPSVFWDFAKRLALNPIGEYKDMVGSKRRQQEARVATTYEPTKQTSVK